MVHVSSLELGITEDQCVVPLSPSGSNQLFNPMLGWVQLLFSESNCLCERTFFRSCIWDKNVLYFFITNKKYIKMKSLMECFL